ncbi:ABC transporter ATP-binding protein [Desnuesiella massiliensis]|uniref:ABC transporter ATP-binding protein n=1 Tax=Desnuesiella massiliensis TaxID=1650662 RepID=UPI0006E2D439|nr:ABC transporter ATP-binding protein [Desnuesiella massiliensis]
MFKKFNIDNSTKFVYSFMLNKKQYILAFILFTGINIFFNILEPQFAKALIDKSLNSSYTNQVLFLGIIWIAMFITKYISKYTFQYLSLKFKIMVFGDIQKHLFNHILKLPMSYFQQNSPAYIVSRQFDDVFGIEGLMISNVIEGLFSILQFIVILIIMFKYSFWLAIISLILIISDIIISFSFPLKKLYKSHNEASAIVKKELTNSFQGIKLIKISAKVSSEMKRNHQFLKQYFAALDKRDTINIVRNISSNFLKNISTPIIVIIGVFLLYTNSITVGTITLFLIYFNKLSQAFTPAMNLIPLFKISKASAERLYEIINIQPEENNLNYSKVTPISHINTIEFKDISFHYEDNINILHKLNFKIEKNQFVAFVGQSGSGKTSIIKLLLKLFRPSNGSIYINGININLIDTKALRKSISYVDQHAFLFNRSLYENLIYSSTNSISKDLLTNYLSELSLDYLISSLHNGLDTMINEDSSNLSGGEKQRLSIIRELLKESDVLILDEYTASLDSITENKIHNKLRELAKNKTIIIIAHKLSTIKNADKIYVLDNGLVIESGNHNELMALKGKYYNLYVNQQNY